MNPVAIRLLSQQLASPQFSTPADVVAHFGAMQAQEYRLMRWAVAMRTRRPSLKAFQRAYDSGEIVRVHLLRATWQLMSAKDYSWIRELTAPRGIATTKGWMHSNRIDIPQEELFRVRDIMLEEASVKRSVTKEDFVEALSRNDIAMDDHRLSYHIRMSEFEGYLCSGDLHPNKATYSLTEQKVGKGISLCRDEALCRLARIYFQSHSPATLEDFVWWSSLGVNDCRRAISLLGEEIHLEKYHQYEFYILDSCRVRGFRSGKAILLPSYDEYLIGYKSRNVSLPEEYRSRAHNQSGIFYPVIASDGVICGNWAPLKPELTVDMFDATMPVEGLEDAWAEYLKYKTR